MYKSTTEESGYEDMRKVAKLQEMLMLLGMELLV